MLNATRFCARVPLRSVRWNSTAPVMPPLMNTLRTDLKAAMRAKDTTRLNVLRALISETNNAAKTASPIQTDIQLLNLIRKRTTAANEAAEQFAAAGRSDLKEKEDAQVSILEEYASRVETLSDNEVKAIVSQHMQKLQASGNKTPLGQILGGSSRRAVLSRASL
ncbi:hypothetical protein N7512_005120 [Penicillium capsulatum]|nr:hypothetical protein N7512_005120 [Penicillium capsulatum]